MADESEEAKRQKALGDALSYVNRRERTVAEVHAHLERRGASEASARAAVRELVEQRLVDDERFAELFVSDKRELEQWGTERIRRGLAARGVPRECAEHAILAADRQAAQAGGDLDAAAGVRGATTELERALQLLRRRFPDPPTERRERDRALGVLLRKGYETELALDALSAHARGD